MKKAFLFGIAASVIISASISESMAMDFKDDYKQEINLKNTELMYLNDTYLLEEKSKIVEVGKDNRGNYVVFDRTIFYPQGGGQPSDTGLIETKEQGYKVAHVSFLDGKVLHYIDGDSVNIKEDIDVFMKVDLERRLINSRAHTSGHLLEAVSKTIAPEIVGMKGYHFLEGPYVEFEGVLSSLKPEIFIDEVNKLMAKSIENNLQIKASNVESEFLNTLKLPTGFKVPIGKQYRIVQIEGFPPVPCGGTHLKNLSELKEVKIKKINSKKGITKVSYSFF